MDQPKIINQMINIQKLHNKISNLFDDKNPITRDRAASHNYYFIADLLPYRFFEPETNLFFNQNSIGFVLEAIPLVGASEEVIDTITGTITDGLPEGCTVQFINWASPKTADLLREWQEPRNKVGGIYKKLAEKRVEYFYNANFKSVFPTSPFTIKDFKLYICVSIPVKNGNSDIITKAFSLLMKAVAASKNASDDNNVNDNIEVIKIIDKLKSLQDQLKTTLKTIGIHSHLMNASQLISFLDELINPNTSPEKSTINYDSLNTINRQIVDFENHLQVDESNLTFFADTEEKQIKARCFSVKNYPTVWAQWQNRDLIGDYFQDLRKMEYPFLTSFSITVPSNETALQAKANTKNFNATRMAGTPIAKFLPEVRTKAQEWQFVTSKTNAGQKILKCIYQVITFAPTNKINEAEQTIKSIYKANGWDLSVDRYVNLQSFLACLPFKQSEGLFDDLEKMGRTKTMVSWTCANLAPLQGEFKGMDSPLMMLMGRRGQPMFWNPFANKEGNYNTAVIGKSGSGKSVFMQELVASIRGFGGKVFVIDDGRSFMNSCRLQGGEFVEFSDAADICLNPFSIINKETMDKSAEYKGEVINLIKAMVKQMCKSIEHITDYENGLIEEAVSYAWETKKNLANITTVRDYFATHKDPRANDLATMIRPFTKDGNYGKLFEGQSNIKITNPLMVFELAEIKNKKDLQAIVLMFLMFLVSENMYFGDRKTPIALVIDEAWDLLHGEGSKTFIEGLARRARKYCGSLITGTQSVNDYYKTPATIAAIENTDWMILLAQKKESVEQLEQSKRIAMDDYLKQNLNSLRMVDHQYSEALIYGPRGYSVGRLILDPYSIALYSSKAEDFARINQLKAEGLSLADALEQIANQKK
jgi:conjugal transfer ATP-binding protein TraC